MKIAVVGTRGFPNVQGGVESHCENLYPRLVALGCAVSVFTRRPYVDPAVDNYKGVKLINLGCPKVKSLEAFAHTISGVFAAKRLKADILHIHAIGPSLLAPLGRLLGLAVVVTNHGPDYKREKWGFIGKAALRLGEAMGSICASEIICISETIARDLKKRYGRTPAVIPNGVNIPQILTSQDALKRYALAKGKYILSVGRFVPEKGFHNLIEAFNLAAPEGWKLVIVGRADHETAYSLKLASRARANDRIVLTGLLTGRALEELYSHAGLFVLPSSYEGMPIVLLEAMSYGLLCLASDIPANRTVHLPEANYFSTGDVELLARKMREFVTVPFSDDAKARQIQMVRDNYNWDHIAQKTGEVYERCLNR